MMKKMGKITKKSLMGAIGILVMLSGITACGAGEEKQEVNRIYSEYQDHGDGTATSTLAEYPTADTYHETFMQGINHFGYWMAEQLSVNRENYFFSPYSLCTALTLLDNAADGDTKRQIEDILGVTDLQDWNMQMSFYMRQEQMPQAMVTSANSLWFDKAFIASDDAYESYLPLVQFYYDAQLYKADFANDPEGTKEQINEWVSQNTNGMIEKFKESVDPRTVLSVINAVYFYGEWEYPFLAALTHEDIFHGAHGDTTVAMMRQSDIWLPYYEAGGMRGLCMPYGDGSKVMSILLPADGATQTVSESFQALSEEDKNTFLQNVINAESRYIMTLHMPKYSMDYSINDLSGILKEMGMVDAFEESLAQFPGIGTVYISDASHMAKLEVDELGSRAAAVTEFAMEECAAFIEDEPVEFIMNQPFMFFIQDGETGMILFMGQVNEL